MTVIEWFLGGHGGYLAVALATHAMVGYVLGLRLFGRPWAGAVGALLADVDLLVPAAWGAPFVHRGLTHSPIAGGATVALASRLGLATAGAVGVGYASQLLIDLTTPKGILLAYPLSTEAVTLPLGGHSPGPTVLLWTAGLAVRWRHRSAADVDAPVDRAGTSPRNPRGAGRRRAGWYGRVRRGGRGRTGGRSPPPRR